MMERVNGTRTQPMRLNACQKTRPTQSGTHAREPPIRRETAYHIRSSCLSRLREARAFSLSEQEYFAEQAQRFARKEKDRCGWRHPCTETERGRLKRTSPRPAKKEEPRSYTFWPGGSPRKDEKRRHEHEGTQQEDPSSRR